MQRKDGLACFRAWQGKVSHVGRDRTVDVVLPSVMVDKRHAILDFRGTTCLLSDAASTSGTFLNGVAVRKPSALKVGDEVRIGGYTLVVVGVE